VARKVSRLAAQRRRSWRPPILIFAAIGVHSVPAARRQMAPSLSAATELDGPFEAVALGNSAIAIAQLRQLDRRLASSPESSQETLTALRARGRILVISEAVGEHSSYFNAGAPSLSFAFLTAVLDATRPPRELVFQHRVMGGSSST
jgi:hypothetical protein